MRFNVFMITLSTTLQMILKTQVIIFQVNMDTIQVKWNHIVADCQRREVQGRQRNPQFGKYNG